MRIHRFYLENINQIDDEDLFVTQETGLIHQLKNVFRYKIGQRLNVFNENIGEIEVEIINMDKKELSFRIIKYIKGKDDKRHTKRQISLYMSIIKNSNFDLIVEKAVELGVYKIIPVVTDRVIKNVLNISRLTSIIKEATEQSGRLDLMKIEDVLNLNDAIHKTKTENNISYFGSIGSILKAQNNNEVEKVSLFIGPEGGFTDDEIVCLSNNDIRPIGLGNYVLRAETAAIVGCGILSL